MAEKIQFPLQPWQKAVLNTCIVSGITILSMVAAGDINSMAVWKAAILAGGLTFLIQAKSLIETDLVDNDEGKSYTPLMFVK